jgi:predicted HicB family RNase H-like nuclease
MEYKGFLGMVEYDAQAKIFHGDIINTRDIITFQGTTVKDIERAFKNSIEDYISWCKEDGVEPEKPYSGKFNVRLPPELHRQIAILAKRRRVSLNSFVEKALTDEVTIMMQSTTSP